MIASSHRRCRVLVTSLLTACVMLNVVSVQATAADGTATIAAQQGPAITCRNPQAQSGIFEKGAKVFSDRDYKLLDVPKSLEGLPFIQSSIERNWIEVKEPGLLTILVPVEDHPATKPQHQNLSQRGFTQLKSPESFQLFGPQKYERVNVFQKQVKAGEQFNFPKFAVVVGQKSLAPWTPPKWTENNGEKLYNGIVLPQTWPPSTQDVASAEPMPVPYLQHPPAVISIDRGRQLFVDDFLIEKTNLRRKYHRPEKHAANPVFKPETTLEQTASPDGTNDKAAYCYLGHGGVFFDPTENLFKMFYTTGWRGGLGMATSSDLVNWTRPDLKLAGQNLLLPAGTSWKAGPLETAGSDNSLWLDLNAKNPLERIKYLTCWDHTSKERRPAGFTHALYTSDGKQWSEGAPTGNSADYCSFFYNPFRNVWVYSIKRDGPRGRCRYYSEHADFMQGADWSNSVYWTNADKLDAPELPGSYYPPHEAPQLYSLNAVAYESVLVGMHYILRGPNNSVCHAGMFPKMTDLEVGFSRDGFHWDRPDRSGFISGSRTEGTWDRAYLHSTTGVFLVLRDQLVFPYTGTSGVSPSGQHGMYTGGSVGLATLRRDGFASMETEANTGMLVTRPVSFSGEQLFVNLKAPAGSLRVAVVDSDGNEIAPFTAANCSPIKTDSTLEQVTWKGAENLSQFQNQPVRFRFELTNGALYSFWVSRDETGRSDGFVASGGPGYDGTIDTAGRSALQVP